MDQNAKINIAGHRGLVGSALMRNLQANGYGNRLTRSHAGLDLADQAAVEAFFQQGKPDYVFHAAWNNNVERLLFPGWRPAASVQAGIRETCQDYLDPLDSAKRQECI